MCVDATNGSTRWQYDGEVLGDESLAVTENAVYVESSESNAAGNYPLVALDPVDGTERFRYATDPEDGSNFVPTAVTEHDGVAYVRSFSGLLAAVDAADGTEQFRISLSDRIASGPRVADGAVFVATAGGRIVAVDAGSGDRLWRQSTGSRAPELAVHGGGLTLDTSRNATAVHRLAFDGTGTWTFTHDAQRAGLTVDDDAVYVGTTDGFLTALSV